MPVVPRESVYDIAIPHCVNGRDDHLGKGHVRVGLEFGDGVHPPNPLHLVLIPAPVVHRLVRWHHCSFRNEGLVSPNLLPKVRVKCDPSLGIARAPHRPHNGEDEVWHGHLLDLVQDLLCEWILSLVANEWLQHGAHDLEDGCDQVVVRGGHGLLELLPDHVDAVRDNRQENLLHLLALACGEFRQRFNPRVKKRGKAHGRGFDINHATPTHSGRRGNSEILHLKHHCHGR